MAKDVQKEHPNENKNEDQLKHILLGKTTDYVDQYDPNILYPVPRKINRDSLGLDATQPMPFYGEDIWHGYELSWLNAKGKPVVALARFSFAFDSINIVESKSFKLYLNSFNQSKFESIEQVKTVLEKDLSATVVGQTKVELFTPNQIEYFIPTALPGTCIDDCDISIDNYQFCRDYLIDCHDNTKPCDIEPSNQISETLHSHLLKSNCLITNQPDWASVVISYEGRKIIHEPLLRYLISFRQHNEFHEQCVERIFNDILQILKPHKLTVVAYYTRRGGLDINPYRSTEPGSIKLARINRQ